VTVAEKLQWSLKAVPSMSLGDGLGYFLVAGAVWLFFAGAFRSTFQRRKISRGQPTGRQIGRELLCSIRNVAIFGLVGGAVVYPNC